MKTISKKGHEFAIRALGLLDITSIMYMYQVKTRYLSLAPNHVHRDGLLYLS